MCERPLRNIKRERGWCFLDVSFGDDRHQSGQKKKMKSECVVRKDERMKEGERESERKRKRSARELRSKKKFDLLSIRWGKKKDN